MSASAAFSALESSLDAVFGSVALLRNTEPVQVVLTQGVELAGDYGAVARVVDTASFRKGVNAQPGDQLSVGTAVWILDHPLASDGERREFVLRAAS